MPHAVKSAVAVATAFVLIVGTWPARAEDKPPENNSTVSYKYNGTSSCLELLGPMNVTFYDLKNNVVAAVPLNANASSVEGSISKTDNGTDMYSLAVKFDTPMTNGNGSTINKITVTLGMSVDAKLQRWSLLTLQLDYSATVSVNGSTKELTQTDHPLVFTRIGYTTKEVDRQCARGYAVCAPLSLSWTCNDQVAKPNPKRSNSTDAGSIEAGITFSGMRLEPFLQGGNGTQSRPEFGNSWDCDPVFSIYLWQGLILSFLLCLVLWWAITMMTTIHINTLFDDPKGPRIMVPTSD